MGLQIDVPALKRKAIMAWVNLLYRYGKSVAQKAANGSLKHETQRVTGNQENAYGWGVYYNGQLKAMGYPNVAPAVKRVQVGKHWYLGRKLIKEYLNEYQSEVAGFELIVVNAMPYSAWQEEGWTPTHVRYRIITQLGGAMNKVRAKIIDEMGVQPSMVSAPFEWTM